MKRREGQRTTDLVESGGEALLTVERFFHEREEFGVNIKNSFDVEFRILIEAGAMREP